MSLGGGYSPSLEYAVQAGINSGVTYVLAAGNENRNADLVSPAGLPAAITVAASDPKDRRVTRLFLTEAGEAALYPALDAYQAIIDRVLALSSDKECDAMGAMMRQVEEALAPEIGSQKSEV